MLPMAGHGVGNRRPHRVIPLPPAAAGTARRAAVDAGLAATDAWYVAGGSSDGST